MNLPTGTVVQILPGGELYSGGYLTIILNIMLPVGHYRVIEDLGTKLTLQPIRGGALVTVWKQ